MGDPRIIGVPALVLDTNVVFDLLVFRDPSCQPLADMLARGTCRWHATARMRAEFNDVLARPAFEPWVAQRAAIAAQWARWSVRVDATPLPAGPTMRCRDPDDQLFLDLALHLRPSHLLSRDRELLRLAGPAGAMGVRIVTPAQFNAR